MELKPSDVHEFACDHCGQSFKRKGAFEAHKCKDMVRTEVMQTLVGKQAYMAWSKWFETRGLIPPAREAFLVSRYFDAFVRFVGFIRRNHIPDVDVYIKFVTDKKLLPFFWGSMDVYVEYMKVVDELIPLDKQLEISISKLLFIAKDNGVELSNVFKTISPNYLSALIASRSVSPWLLMCSGKFADYYRRLNSRERVAIDTVIDIGKWQKILETNPEQHKKSISLVKQYQL